MESNEKEAKMKYALLIAVCIAINFIGVKIATFFNLPVFLDCIGTLLAAVLGGFLPGITVGFVSNLINGISDIITLYYGIISILLAVAAALLKRKGVFDSYLKTLETLPVFVLIGGGIGSILSWFLYGFDFGSGISAPLAKHIYSTQGWSVFASQLTADILIDILDKFIALTIVFVVFKLLSDKIKSSFATDLFFDGGGEYYRKRSLRTDILVMIISMVLILGVLSVSISFFVYKKDSIANCEDTAYGISHMAVNKIPADEIDRYLKTEKEDDTYKATVEELKNIKESFSIIEYLYVYKIKKDGCHVVFDLDTDTTEGSALGEVVPFDESFSDSISDLLNGKTISPIISNDTYGWLMTVYEPIIDSTGKCVAYLGVDIAMQEVVAEWYKFVIRMISLIFGALIIMMAIALWFANTRLVTPINSMTMAAGEFAYENEEERLITSRNMVDLDIHTGNEIENLYSALKKTVCDMSEYIDDIKKKSGVISKMQNNIITSFANMVENRDEGTGEHVKRTSSYVNMIAEELKREGVYTEDLDGNKIENMVTAAPLHDIGKIKISDFILNKPGRLTAEEFELMKTHTTEGANILKQTMGDIGEFDYLNTAVNMAESHHEKWDETGYPNGKAGEEIPLCARIMAVSDVFDALISKRSYKDAMPFDEAVDIIKGLKNSQFDPKVVDAFINIKEEIREYIINQ